MLQGPKAEAGHADARSLSFDGQSAAAAARSGIALDLITIAARVDAGPYVMRECSTNLLCMCVVRDACCDTVFMC